MRSGFPFSHLETIGRYFGLWLAVLALIGQVGLAATAHSATTGEVGDGLKPFTLVICHTGNAADDRAPPHHNDSSDCALCPLCFVASHTAAILVPGGVGPDARPAYRMTRFAVPPAHAPPSRVVTATYSTGPPRRA